MSMKLYVVAFLLALFVADDVFSQSDTAIFRYSSFSISDSLKKHADAVYRLDEAYVDISSPSKYSYKSHSIVTLLNKNAQHHLNQSIVFDKFMKIDNIEIKVYDALGLPVKKYTKKDFQTSNYDDRMSLYTDDKILHLEAVAPGYPCTIETSYEYKMTSYVSLPGWNIVSPDEAVESSRYVVSVPAALDIRYHVYGIDVTPSIETVGENKTYTWVAHNVIAEPAEANTYGTTHPHIQIAPNAFEYDGYKGDMKTWKNYGEWGYALFNDPKPLDKQQTEEILTATAACKSDKEKVKLLYERLKKNTRYVNISLGIGGYKPFPVQFVQTKKYGDCKALTNYMRYMLKAAGINSYPALVNAGYNKTPASPGFPAQVFNHVILCVPLQSDTVWLECTSNNNECGVLGNSTENKNALLLTENGGVLVATPKSNCNENILSTKTIINVNTEGGSQTTSAVYCKGDFTDLFDYAIQLSNDEQKNIFVNSFHYRTPDRFMLQYKGDSAEGNLFSVSLDYDQQYDFKAGSKIFFPQKINRLCNEDFNNTVDRKHNYIFNYPYKRTDTTVFVLPAGTTIENLPAAKEISNAYLYYNNSISKNEAGNIITVVAELSIKRQLVPPKDYHEVMGTLSMINQNEKEKIVLKKS